jgi:hypothetical protein
MVAATLSEYIQAFNPRDERQSDVLEHILEQLTMLDAQEGGLSGDLIAPLWEKIATYCKTPISLLGEKQLTILMLITKISALLGGIESVAHLHASTLKRIVQEDHYATIPVKLLVTLLADAPVSLDVTNPPVLSLLLSVMRKALEQGNISQLQPLFVYGSREPVREALVRYLREELVPEGNRLPRIEVLTGVVELLEQMRVSIAGLQGVQRSLFHTLRLLLADRPHDALTLLRLFNRERVASAFESVIVGRSGSQRIVQAEISDVLFLRDFVRDGATRNQGSSDKYCDRVATLALASLGGEASAGAKQTLEEIHHGIGLVSDTARLAAAAGLMLRGASHVIKDLHGTQEDQDLVLNAVRVSGYKEGKSSILRILALHGTDIITRDALEILKASIRAVPRSERERVITVTALKDFQEVLLTAEVPHVLKYALLGALDLREHATAEITTEAIDAMLIDFANYAHDGLSEPNALTVVEILRSSKRSYPDMLTWPSMLQICEQLRARGGEVAYRIRDILGVSPVRGYFEQLLEDMPFLTRFVRWLRIRTKQDAPHY